MKNKKDLIICMREKRVKLPFFALVVTILLAGVIVFRVGVEQARAWTGNIIIDSDGTVSPASAPILRSGNVYTLTQDGASSSGNLISVRRGGARAITLDGAGHRLYNPFSKTGIGIFLEGDSSHGSLPGITIRKMISGNLETGISSGEISLDDSKIAGNNISNCAWCSIDLARANG
jgi:hypothetical protein